MPPEVIRVVGLREFRRNLKRLNREAPKGIKVASNKAAQIIVEEAKPRVPLGPGKGGHAKSSIKAASTGTAARVQAGGKKYPYYAWLDFGGRVGRGHNTRRPFLKSGRYIWSAYEDKRVEIERVLAEELENVAQANGMGST